MSDRARELATRHAALQLRVAMQRREIASEVGAVESRLQSLDRFLVLGRSVLHNPAVVGLGLLAVVLIGRTRAVRLVGQAVLIASGMRGLLRTTRRFL
jgi:hypothetical protein